MRERQSAYLAGQLAERIEQEQPGRIHCIKLVTTRFKTTTTIVYNRQRVNAPVNVREDDSDDSDEEGDGAELGSGPPAQNVAAPKPAAAAEDGSSWRGTCGEAAWWERRCCRLLRGLAAAS